MRIIIGVIVLFLFSISLIEAAQPSGIVRSYSKFSDWDEENQQYVIYIAATFETEEVESTALILKLHLNDNELSDLHLEEGTEVIFLEETPHKVLGKSTYLIEFISNEKIYEVTEISAFNYFGMTEIPSIGNIETVQYIGTVKMNMSNYFTAIVLSGGDEQYLPPGAHGEYQTGKVIPVGIAGAKKPTWTKVGNRWLTVGPHIYIDLDSGLVIKKGKPEWSTQRT